MGSGATLSGWAKRLSWVALLLISVLAGGPAAAEPGDAAGALLADGRLEEAAAAAQACAAAEARCALVLGRARLAQGAGQQAAEALAGARGRAGSLEPTLLRLLGEALLKAGRAAEAAEPLAAAIELDPAGPAGVRAAALLADALFAAGRFAEAAQQAQRAAALPGQPPEVKAGLSYTAAQALAARARTEPPLVHEAALALRSFWLQHPEHPGAQAARDLQRELEAALPAPSGRELLVRASRLLAAGQPAAAVAQAQAAAAMLTGEDAAEAQLLYARALAADGRRTDAAESLQRAWKTGAPHVAAQAGLLFARDRARRDRDADAIRIAAEVSRKYPAAPEAEEAQLFVARLELDAGNVAGARARLARLAARRRGANASAARWQLAWLSRAGQLPDAVERFAEFAASAESDEERAQGIYWQARSGPAEKAAPLYRRAAQLDPLGWYGLLARDRLGLSSDKPAPFPPPVPAPAAAPGPRLALAEQLAGLGLLAEAAAEIDVHVREHGVDAEALLLYERARRFDRSTALADSLLGARSQLPRLEAMTPRLRAVLAAAYPAAFPAEVAASARRTGLDPYLLLSIMRRESVFKADARSAAGAVGLLQLLPATARRAAVVLGRPPLRDDELVVPATAIDLGAWYLAELVGRFGDPAVAAAAYNAGPRIAAPWAAKGKGEELDAWVEDIPYRETRRYVKVVIGFWSAYRILAGGAPPRLVEAVPELRPGAQF